MFVQVKYRSSEKSGFSLAAVGRAKQRVIGRTADYYLTVYCKDVDVPCRFDVVGIDGTNITWIKNAFDYRC